MTTPEFENIDPNALPKHFESRSAEEKWDAFWQARGTYFFDEKDTSKEVYSIDTPPPTVSGSLHIGHVFSYTHTDIQARFERMSGKNVFYPMGWDDNGLPTERRVQNYFHVQCDPHAHYENNLKLEQASAKDRKSPARNVSRPNFIELCHQITKEDERIFMHLFKRIGLSVDWREEYATIDDRCRKLSQYSFIDLFKKGHVYNLEAPTMWDTDFQTAVAQAEVEDRETDGAYHHIEFEMQEGGEKFTIATTRPELLPACIGVAAHPDDSRFKHLFGKTAVTPLFFAPVKVFPTELADPEKGTGILMVCSFGDATDVQWWREQKLPLRQIIQRNGRLRELCFGTEQFPSLKPDLANQHYSQISGRNLKQSKNLIVEMLKNSNSSVSGKTAALVKDPSPIKHPVKYYEKGDRPLEFVSTRQWFVGLMKAKEDLLTMGEKIEWLPQHMFSRFKNWTENLQMDWCISRQRYFGVAFPVWYPLDASRNPQFDRPILAEESQLPVDPFVDCPKGFAENQRDQAGGFTADPDVFDTWFTSSISPQISTRWILDSEKYKKLFPMSMRPQGHDIIRTWAFYTIAKSWLHEKNIPWKHIALSGWILDPDRKKMSKSKGNVVTPEHLLDEYSSDAIRYWAGSARLGADTAFDEQILKIGRRLTTKIYNASKFVLMQTGSKAQVSQSLDLSFLATLSDLVAKASSHFQKFQFAPALQEIEKFFWSSFTDSYIEMTKTRAKEGNQDEKNSAVTSLRITLNTMLRLFAPFLPFITEEIWSWSFAKETGIPSIHSSPWPTKEEIQREISKPGDSKIFETASLCFSQINKFKSENQLSTGASLDQLKITAPGSSLEILKQIQKDLQSATRVAIFEWEVAPTDSTEIIVSN